MNTHEAIEGVVPWPPAVAEQYRQAGYWQGASIVAPVRQQVALRPQQEAVVDGATRLTYQQLWDKAGACAQYLLDLGIKPGERVILQLPNCWQFAAVSLACFRVGIIPVMIQPAHRRHEITHLAALAEAVAIVTVDADRDADLRQVAHEVAAQVASVRTVIVHGSLSGNANERDLAAAWDVAAMFDETAFAARGADICCLLVSGGTTGLPKLIVRSHDDYACNVRYCNAATAIDETTVYLGTLPGSHNFPLACPGILGVLFAGGTIVMLPTPAPERVLRTIDAEAVTVATAVPAVAQAWIEHQRQHNTLHGSSLRVLQVGGSRMPDELAARVKPVLGATLQQVFGMAEGLINMTRLDDDDEVIINTQGRPVCAADEVVVVNAQGDSVPDGTPGSLLTRGPYTPRGYFRAPANNAKSFTADGWYMSGDIVVRRPDGNLVVAGRDKDMINRGGENISAEEIENFAYQIDGVRVAAAVAMPDAILGERVCLYLELAAGSAVSQADVATVMNNAGVAHYKIPEKVVCIDRIPSTKVGKTDKKALREDVRLRLAKEAS